MLKVPVRVDVLVNGSPEAMVVGVRPHCMVIVMVNLVPTWAVVNV